MSYHHALCVKPIRLPRHLHKFVCLTYSLKTIAGSISSHVSKEKYIAVTIVTDSSRPRPILLWWVEIILSAPMYCIVPVKLTNINKTEWE